MVARPSSYPVWTNGPSGTVVQPAAELAETGWSEGQAPDAENVNWQLWDINEWIEYLDGLISGGVPNAWMRLVNGGNWSFNASSGVFAWSATANISIPGMPDSANALAAGSVTLADGQVAYVNANSPTVAQGDTDGVTAAITSMNFVGNITAGMFVSGPGIPINTTVLGVASNSVTLSNATTSSNTQADYTFYNTGFLSMSVADESTILPTSSQILIAKRAGNVIYLGINCAQMVLRDGEFKTLIGSGYFDLYQSTAGENLTAGQLVYISPGGSDGGRTAGELYKLDTSAAHQQARGTYAGVVITSVSSGQPATVLFSGFYLGSSLVAGDMYFADPTTPGGITNVSPTGAGQRIVPVGFAVSSTVILYTGAQAQAGINSSFQMLFAEFPTDTGDHQNFTLSQPPLNAQGVFVFVDGILLPNTLWSLSSETLTLGSAISPPQKVYVQYVLADQTYIAGMQEVPTNPSVDHKTFVLSGVPTNQASTMVYVDGVLLDDTQWSLTVGIGPAYVTLANVVAAGQDVYVTYFTSAPIAGTITGVTNLGTGIGIFAGLSGTIAQLRSIVAGSNVTVTQVMGGIQISATGGGGGGGPVAVGSFGSPMMINPTVGITPTSDLDQVWWITPTGSTPGANAITSTPQIAAGTSLGQRLTLFGVNNGSAGYLRIVNGNGTNQNGDFNFSTGQCLVYNWNGAAWQMVSNAI